MNTNGWKPDDPGWTTGELTVFTPPNEGAQPISSLRSPLFDIPASREVTISAPVLAGKVGPYQAKARLALLGFLPNGNTGFAVASNEASSGTLTLTAKFTGRNVKYQIVYAAFGAFFDGKAASVQFGTGAVATEPTASSRAAIAAKEASIQSTIPSSQHPLVVGDKIDKRWFNFLSSVAGAVPTPADVEDKLGVLLDAMPTTDIQIHHSPTTEAIGSRDDGYQISLRPLADSGVGDALVKITRDAYGRVEGTEAATTDDLPEGSTNLYHTDARRSEVLVADGMSAPPVMLTNEAEEDFIHQG